MCDMAVQSLPQLCANGKEATKLYFAWELEKGRPEADEITLPTLKSILVVSVVRLRNSCAGKERRHGLVIDIQICEDACQVHERGSITLGLTYIDYPCSYIKNIFS